MTDTTGIRSVLSKETLTKSVFPLKSRCLCAADSVDGHVYFMVKYYYDRAAIMLSIREREVYNERKRQKRCDHGV